MDTATISGIDAVENTSKRVIQKAAEAACELIWSKIVDKITSLDRTKSKEKDNER